MGAGVQVLGKSPEAAESILSAPALEFVGRLTSLEELSLSGCAITDAGLERLTRLRKLEVLDLRHTSVTVEGVLRLAPLPKLRGLMLNELELSPREEAAIRGAFPSLRQLESGEEVWL